jgi:hypothetical protein
MNLEKSIVDDRKINISLGCFLHGIFCFVLFVSFITDFAYSPSNFSIVKNNMYSII